MFARNSKKNFQSDQIEIILIWRRLFKKATEAYLEEDQFDSSKNESVFWSK